MAELSSENLLITHNLSTESLLFAMDIGGFSMPSLAIINPNENELTNFGEITLIAKEDLFSPSTTKKSKVYTNDIYTVRMPDVKYVHSKKSMNIYMSLIDEFKKDNNITNDRYEQLGIESYDYLINKCEIDFRFFSNNHLIELFLLSKNIDIQYKDEQSHYEVEFNLKNELNKNNLMQEYDGFIEVFKYKIIDNDIISLKFFNKRSNNGNKLYKDYNIENCFKYMKSKVKNGIKNTEKSFENKYVTIGQLKAFLSKELPSNNSIINNKHKIKNYLDINKAEDDFLTYSINKFKKAFGNEYNVNTLYAIAAYKSGEEDFMDFLIDYQIPNKKIAIEVVEDCIKKFNTIPSPYFELKHVDIVNFSDFSHAIIPDNLLFKNKITQMLNENGVKIIEYNSEKQKNERKEKELMAKNGDDYKSITNQVQKTLIEQLKDINNNNKNIMKNKPSF